MFFRLFLSIVLVFLQIQIAFAGISTPYTCPKIKRQKEQVDWKCLDQASNKLIYKAQLMSEVLLEQVEKIERQLGERQSVFFIARAGSSLSGFEQLKSHDKNGKRISLDEVFDYGIDQMPNKSLDISDFENNPLNNDSNSVGAFHSALHRAKRKVTKKYIDKKRSKLKYSHGGLLFRTTEGTWNIYHELMPCNETKKAYLFQDSAMSGNSSFFLDKPHKYIGLIVPLDQKIQKRIIKSLNNKEEFMARGPVYRSMSNPWQANTQNSNSFPLEMIEYANMPESKYEQLSVKYKAAVEQRNNYLNEKRLELGVDILTVKQMEQIEKKDDGYKMVCRPDYEVRKEAVKSYVNNGYEPTKIIFDTSFNTSGGVGKFFKEWFESFKVGFIPIVGEHIRPSKKTYKEHLKLGIGEAVSVYSIWKYLERSQLIHPGADASMFEIPELNYATAKRLKPFIEANISQFYDEDRHEAEYAKFNKVLKDMKKNK